VAAPSGGPDIKWDQQAFGRAMRGLRVRDKAIYDNTRKVMRAEITTIKKAQAAAVQGLDSSGSSGGGSVARASADFIKSAGRDGSRANEKNLARAIRRSGLRQTVARGLKTEYRERATSKRPFIGVRVRMSGNSMPAGQGRLPKHMNYGSWRHPVYGNKDAAWAVTTVKPIGWFDATFVKHKAQAAAAIGRAIDAAFAQFK